METEKKVTIAAHDGMFHPDDVFAVATLLLLLENAPVRTQILRTRDMALLQKADYVVDVGGVYNEATNRFDHHQEGGAGVRDNGIRFASFGLVWKKYGATITGSVSVAERIAYRLVMAIDAGDNGQTLYDHETFTGVSPATIDDYIYNLRPAWDESSALLDEQFLKAVTCAREVLLHYTRHAKASERAEALVRKAYDEAPDKRIVVLPEFYPSQRVLELLPEPLFVIYPKMGDGGFTVKSVHEKGMAFQNRKDFPSAWAGKRDAELQRITGVSDAVFCHNGRFMVVAKSKEGALKLAQLALN